MLLRHRFSNAKARVKPVETGWEWETAFYPDENGESRKPLGKLSEEAKIKMFSTVSQRI